MNAMILVGGIEAWKRGGGNIEEISRIPLAVNCYLRDPQEFPCILGTWNNHFSATLPNLRVLDCWNVIISVRQILFFNLYPT